MNNVDVNKRILVLCPFPIGVAASQRLKYEQYFDDWRSEGFIIEVSAFMDMSMWKVVYSPGHVMRKLIGGLLGYARRYRDIFRISNYDIVYVHMWATPFGSKFYELLVRRLAKCLVYDIEDNLLIGTSKNDTIYHPNRWLTRIKGPGKARFLIKTADYVITSSPFLNDICLQINKRRACIYISSSVDTERFFPVNVYSNDRPVVIGWTGTFSSKVYLDLLSGVFLALAERVEFKLKVIGNFDYELRGINLEVVQWTRETEVSDLQGIDIGIYPLPLDDWVLGKSGLKAIQYMAFGLPTVATNVGMAPILISHEIDGLLVDSEEGWIAALETLVRDPLLRLKLGQAARNKVVHNYSVNVIKHRYRNVLEQFTKGTEDE